VGGAGGNAAAAAPAAGSGGIEPQGPACDGAVPVKRDLASRLDLPIRLAIGSASAEIDVAAAADGRELRVSLFKFFLTEPVLVDAAGRETKGQVVDAEGKPLPYGVQLVDMEEPSPHFRIAASDGIYSRLRFGVGVPPGCNAPSNSDHVYPLNPDSEMYWGWAARFMFIRIEGSSRATPTQEFAPFLYHVGFDAAFAHITVEGALTVNGVGSGPTLVLDIARMLATEAQMLPAPQHAVPDGWVPDNLENNAAFTLQ
jgi:hypothetical protein